MGEGEEYEKEPEGATGEGEFELFSTAVDCCSAYAALALRNESGGDGLRASGAGLRDGAACLAW